MFPRVMFAEANKLSLIPSSLYASGCRQHGAAPHSIDLLSTSLCFASLGDHIRGNPPLRQLRRQLSPKGEPRQTEQGSRGEGRLGEISHSRRNWVQLTLEYLLLQRRTLLPRDCSLCLQSYLSMAWGAASRWQELRQTNRASRGEVI